jgi:formylglycine-generating enzyme required for sulfatase activity
MVVVPSGTFSMGAPQSEIDQHHAFPNEGPGHTVSISRPFAVSKFEVTFDQWDACIQDGGCRGFRPSDSGWGRQKHPVINISWDDAKLYVKWLSNKTGKVYRLLSEAEWEYAARAGSTAKYFFGDDPMSLCRYANIADDSGNAYRYPSTGFRAWLTCNDGYFHTAPVGSFVSNDFGLYDVLGNVSEWVEDGWHDNYQGAPTYGSTWVAGADPQLHVARGGSWYSLQDGVTSSVRYKYVASPGGELVGLRIARTLGQ